LATYFVTRHPAAVQWSQKNGFIVDQVVVHFDPAIVKVNDVVAGSLPVNQAANVCQRGGRYFHFSLDTPQQFRGLELTVDQLEQFNARLEEFSVVRIENASQ
jgi:CRISPR-associated protein Csx16